MAKLLKSITFPGLEGEYEVVNPMDYGLGTVCQPIGSWNDALVNGYYKSNGDAPDNYWWWGEVIAYADNSSVVQHVMRWVDGNISHVWRTGSRDAWGEWEWENPPMTSGVEYRTTERWHGKPVYKYLLDFGALPNNTFKNVNVEIPGVLVIDVSGFFEAYDTSEGQHASGNVFALGEVDGHWCINRANYFSVAIKTNGDCSAYRAYLTIKYIKG